MAAPQGDPAAPPSWQRHSHVNRLGCESVKADLVPREPPSRAPPAWLCFTAPTPALFLYLKKKKKKACLQPPQPFFSPPEGAPGVGEGGARTGGSPWKMEQEPAPHRQQWGIPKVRVCLPLPTGTLPQVYKWPLGDLQGLPVLPRSIEAPGLDQSLGNGARALEASRMGVGG